MKVFYRVRRYLVEAEMKKIDESGSSTSNNKEKSEAKKDPYDYFLKKEKAE